ncbi:hypothetical protein MYAER_1312 [Microcystis aeruginosa NIES-2549]|uniref:Uncharacterized protein n=1 Tax=Microcystis aeruginosa NIES-2549 TaxID=1641812 RepID=A0A0F6RKA3_MICAE|nr:hypothetical protein MYAER_1312 [Microcystis aeruginosa NIES-2549]AOC52060.1 hypothetical protein amyaer_1325 [Microcystis aeruginosa NIES-2481]
MYNQFLGGSKGSQSRIWQFSPRKRRLETKYMKALVRTN